MSRGRNEHTSFKADNIADELRQKVLQLNQSSNYYNGINGQFTEMITSASTHLNARMRTISFSTYLTFLLSAWKKLTLSEHDLFYTWKEVEFTAEVMTLVLLDI